MPQRVAVRGRFHGQRADDERRLPEIFKGPKCRGSDRSIGRPPDRPSPDASRHQARGGCAAGRETILRFQPVLEGIPRREESGVPRDHPGRALRWISEGREGAPVSNRFDASAGPSDGRTRDAPRARGEESPLGNLGQRRVRAELPGGAGPRRARRTRRSSVPGTRREGLEQHLLGRTRDRITRRDEGSRGSRAVRHGATSELEQSLHEATRQLALGDAEGATKVANEIDAKATLLKKLYVDTTKSFDATEAQMSYLRGEGVLTNGLEADIKIARDMIEKGLIEAASAMATRL